MKQTFYYVHSLQNQAGLHKDDLSLLHDGTSPGETQRLWVSMTRRAVVGAGTSRKHLCSRDWSSDVCSSDLFIELVMPSNHFILCCPLLLLPSIFPSIRVFSNESALCIRWPKYWSFSIKPQLGHVERDCRVVLWKCSSQEPS